jgi:hypothetical protein
MDYAKQYSDDELPSIWFINKTIRLSGLQTRKPKKRTKGGSEYLLYPVQAIRALGSVHQSADFIGKKYIAGQREPINIWVRIPLMLVFLRKLDPVYALYICSS